MNKHFNIPSINQRPQIGTGRQEFRAVEKKKIAGLYSVPKIAVLDLPSVIIYLFYKTKKLLVAVSLAILYAVSLHCFPYHFSSFHQ